MAEYIEREAVKDIFCDACSTKTRYKRTVEQCRNKIDTDGNRCFKMRLIDRTPTADVEEVRHGKWVDNHNGTFTCSVCGGQSSKMDYCGRCGAKMDGKGDT